MRPILLLALIAGCLSAAESHDLLMLRGLDGDDATAIATLRALGPQALVEIAAVRANTQTNEMANAAWDRLADAVAQCRDASRLGLYWYTDLAAAEAEARRTGKPILSLTLLGKLTDQYSCANSRLFRALLYPDPAVNALLRERVILHWRSERPVPQVTIDFGDGRTIRTTVAGNSIHYLLDADGRVLDAFPGMYAPKRFAALVAEAVDAAKALPTDGRQRQAALRLRLEAMVAACSESIRTGTGPGIHLVASQGLGHAAVAVPEVVAAVAESPIEAAERVTVSKCAVESPLLHAIGMWRRDGDSDELRRWLEARAAASPDVDDIDAGCLPAVRASLGGGRDADDAVIAATRRSIACDDVLDEEILRPLVLRELIRLKTGDRAALDRWAYDALFLTPAADPWLGLLPKVYTGLPDNGAIVPPRVASGR